MAAGFDRSVWSLGRRDNRNHLVKISAIARAIAAQGSRRILEVGAGTGLHARWILENTPAEYVGVDVSEAMLAIATRRLAPHAGRFRLGIADAHRLPFPDGSFDAAFCSGTLHHLADPGRGLAELARVVRPGGRVAAMEPNWKFPSVLLVSAFTKAERNAFKINGASLARWASGAGLAGVRLERLLYTPPSPRALERIWDRADALAARVPGLRRLSIMLLVSGRRA
ncbi:MAG: class I SAM-dependent methyltransferase [Acidobacteria bacterium]|nr:class I SAM-dependent methyltransferase [Acidobacteriota bacterium]